MKFAIISDIHSNVEAITEVFKHIDAQHVDEILCLGDVIGYGPDPVQVTDIIMERCRLVLCGNHDEALVQGAAAFNKYARDAIAWTKKQLKPGLFAGNKAKDRLDFLERLPLRYERDGILYVHASPRDPTSEYILENDLAMGDNKKFEEIFAAFEKMLFVGHTHIPCVITQDLHYYALSDLTVDGARTCFKFDGRKAIINVGSTGQPRDRDVRACYVTVDEEAGPQVEWHRVPYNHESTCEKILRNRHLDDKLGKRLLEGV